MTHNRTDDYRTILDIIHREVGSGYGLTAEQILSRTTYSDADGRALLAEMVRTDRIVKLPGAKDFYTDRQITRYRTKRERTILRVLSEHPQLSAHQIAALIGKLSVKEVETICALLAEMDELKYMHVVGDVYDYEITELGVAATKIYA